MFISESLVDQAMYIIVNCKKANFVNYKFDENYLLMHGIPEDMLEGVISELRHKKLITLEPGKKDGKDVEIIQLTDKGENYFTDKEAQLQKQHEIEVKELEKEKRQFAHDWKIAIFSSLSGALLSKPIWDIIDFLFGLFEG